MATPRFGYRDLPCTVAVPVVRDDFVSLHPEHRDLGVVTDLGAIDAFGIGGPDPEELLHADLQFPGWGGVWFRLGSGRSGFYRDHYLKGVGRTPLAANWNRPSDWYHGTGHMFPTSALREYLATVYLEARGLGARIVPCRGLLLQRMSDRLRAQVERATGASWSALAPIDRALQAITAKPADFGRLSNFVWCFETLSGWGEEWRQVAPTLHQLSQPPEAAPLVLEDCTPDAVGASLREAVGRTLQSFEEYFQCGVQWGSTWNNMTLDGRFLDLEVPTFACRPFLGGVSPFDHAAGSAGDGPPHYFNGLEQMDAALDLELGLRRLGARLGALLEQPLQLEPNNRLFMSALREAIQEVAGDPSLFGHSELFEAACRRLLPLSQDASAVRSDIEHYSEQRRSAEPRPWIQHALLVRTEHRFHRVEPLASQSLWLQPDGYDPADWEDAAFFDECLKEIEKCDGVDRALLTTQEVEAALRRRFA